MVTKFELGQKKIRIKVIIFKLEVFRNFFALGRVIVVILILVYKNKDDGNLPQIRNFLNFFCSYLANYSNSVIGQKQNKDENNYFLNKELSGTFSSLVAKLQKF